MAKSSVPRITETEWEVMRAVWAQHPVTAATIIERLVATDPTWHPKTVRTLLARLVGKGALRHRSEGRAYVYTPRVTEQECAAAASETFLERVFGGALKPLLVHFVAQRRLTRQELDELRTLVDQAENAERPARRSS